MSAYGTAMRKYAVFRGRASRREFWQFSLAYVLLALVVIVVDQSLFGVDGEGSGVLTGIFSLIHILPALGVLVRRLHDIDRTGWWVLLNITGIGFFVLLIMAALEGTQGSNRHGPAPYDQKEARRDVDRRDRRDARDQDQDRDRDRDRRELRREPGSDPNFGLGRDAPPVGDVRPSAAPPAPRDVIGELERLAQLRASGGLTDAEFEVIKAQTLSRGSNG